MKYHSGFIRNFNEALALYALSNSSLTRNRFGKRIPDKGKWIIRHNTHINRSIGVKVKVGFGWIVMHRGGSDNRGK